MDYLLDLINDLSLSTPVLVKFHPSTDSKKFTRRLQGNIKLVESGLYDLLKEARLVIGMSTGALVEAVSIGVPAVCVDNKSKFSHSNYFSEFGKGVVWERAETASEVHDLIGRFAYSLKHDAGKVQSASKELRGMYFCEPTEEAVINAFDL